MPRVRIQNYKNLSIHPTVFPEMVHSEATQYKRKNMNLKHFSWSCLRAGNSITHLVIVIIKALYAKSGWYLSALALHEELIVIQCYCYIPIRIKCTQKLGLVPTNIFNILTSQLKMGLPIVSVREFSSWNFWIRQGQAMRSWEGRNSFHYSPPRFEFFKIPKHGYTLRTN